MGKRKVTCHRERRRYSISREKRSLKKKRMQRKKN
jgi:hypothetical protein